MNDIIYAQEDGDYKAAVAPIFDALRKAEQRRPGWPDDVVHGATIVAERAGEVIRAAIEVAHEGESIEVLRRELAYTGALAIRMLLALHRSKEKPRIEDVAFRCSGGVDAHDVNCPKAPR